MEQLEVQCNVCKSKIAMNIIILGVWISEIWNIEGLYTVLCTCALYLLILLIYMFGTTQHLQNS